MLKLTPLRPLYCSSKSNIAIYFFKELEVEKGSYHRPSLPTILLSTDTVGMRLLKNWQLNLESLSLWLHKYFLFHRYSYSLSILSIPRLKLHLYSKTPIFLPQPCSNSWIQPLFHIHIPVVNQNVSNTATFSMMSTDLRGRPVGSFQYCI